MSDETDEMERQDEAGALNGWNSRCVHGVDIEEIECVKCMTEAKPTAPAPQAKCETCGSPVRVVGETTLSYEPVQASEVLPAIPNYVAHPQSVWFDEHWRPVVMRLATELEQVKRERDEWMSKYGFIGLANSALSRSDHVAFGSLMTKLSKANDEVKRLREVLEFYADGDYSTCPSAGDYHSPMDDEGGKRARAALGREW